MSRLALYLLLLICGCSAEAHVRASVRERGTVPPEGKSVTIGLLIPDSSATEAIRAATLAIEEANNNPVPDRPQFQLVVRTTEGPWGAGSKQSVSLVYEDESVAIVGSLDGRNGHLAEQVATKSHLAYVETHATEPTLSQAFVPWFFRVVPNDNQQALAIYKLIEQQGGSGIAILTSPGYDTRYAVRSLTRTVAAKSGTAPLLIDAQPGKITQRELRNKLFKSHITHLVIPFYAPFLETLLPGLTATIPSLKIYGTLHFTMGLENTPASRETFEKILLVGSGFRFSKAGKAFRDKYLKRYGEEPGNRAAYTFDAVSLVIHAVRRTGTDREKIPEFISAHTRAAGITGTLSFDEMGNRQLEPLLITIHNGRFTLPDGL